MSDQEPIIQTIRTFMAVAIDEAARKALAEVQNAMKRIGSGVSWVTPANIHVTLVFLGDVFETLIPPLSAAMDTVAARHAPCALDIQGLGYFGSPRSPKVVWAGLRGDVQPLAVLQEEIMAALKAAGGSPDTKPFHPHVTLGRVRFSRQTGDLVNFISSRGDMRFGPLNVQSVLLMKSRLTPQGPIYTPLHESPLSSRSTNV